MKSKHYLCRLADRVYKSRRFRNSMMIVTIAWMVCLIMSVAGVMEAEMYPVGKKTAEGAVGTGINLLQWMR